MTGAICTLCGDSGNPPNAHGDCKWDGCLFPRQRFERFRPPSAPDPDINAMLDDCKRMIDELPSKAEFDALVAELERLRRGEAMYPAEAVIEGANIVIRVPISAIPIAFAAHPQAPENDQGDPLYAVTDAATFAKGIVRYLNEESEDGTTRIHIMLDSAMMEALEQGEEGIEQIRAADAREG